MNLLPVMLSAALLAGGTHDPRPDGTIYIKAVPPCVNVSGENYEIENSADKRYEEMKAMLDKKFERMFAIKAKLNEINSKTDKMWEEYHSLNREYEKQLKAIIAVWVTENCK